MGGFNYKQKQTSAQKAPDHTHTLEAGSEAPRKRTWEKHLGQRT